MAVNRRFQQPSGCGIRAGDCQDHPGLLRSPLKNERINSGQFIHGNNDFSSLGKYVSGGCIRMDNEVIKQLAKIVKRGDLVIFRKIK